MLRLPLEHDPFQVRYFIRPGSERNERGPARPQALSALALPTRRHCTAPPGGLRPPSWRRSRRVFVESAKVTSFAPDSFPSQ